MEQDVTTVASIQTIRFTMYYQYELCRAHSVPFGRVHTGAKVLGSIRNIISFE